MNGRRGAQFERFFGGHLEGSLHYVMLRQTLRVGRRCNARLDVRANCLPTRERAECWQEFGFLWQVGRDSHG